MVHHRIVVRIQEDLVFLVHVSRVVTYTIFRLALSQELAPIVLLWFVFSPYEEFVRTLIPIWTPILMGLEKSGFSMWESICRIGMHCHTVSGAHNEAII